MQDAVSMSAALSTPRAARDTPRSWARAGRAIGALMFSLFGTLWISLACLAWFEHPLPAVLVPVALGVALAAYALRCVRRARPLTGSASADPERSARMRRFNRINAAQWGALFVLVPVLNGLGLGAWVPSAIMLVVGLHFLPLASTFEYRNHRFTGGAMILLALSYPWLAPAGPADPIGPFAAGLILWISALVALRWREPAQA